MISSYSFVKALGDCCKRLRCLNFIGFFFGAGGAMNLILFKSIPCEKQHFASWLYSFITGGGHSISSSHVSFIALFAFICFITPCLGKAVYQLVLRYGFVSKPLFSFLWGVGGFSSSTVHCVDVRLSSLTSWMGAARLCRPQLAAVSWGCRWLGSASTASHLRHCCSSNMLSQTSLCNQMLLFPYCQKSRKSGWPTEGLWQPKGNAVRLCYRSLRLFEGPVRAVPDFGRQRTCVQTESLNEQWAEETAGSVNIMAGAISI